MAKAHRPVPAKDYLEKQYSIYCKLVENSNALAKKLTDKLAPLPQTGLLLDVSVGGNKETNLLLNDVVNEV